MQGLLLAGVGSLLLGGVLGLFGGGGAILAVPVLVHAVGLGPKQAIAASLLFVGFTSLVGTAQHARTGRVHWKLGAIFGVTSMSGAFVGGRLAQFMSERALLVGLGAIMLVTALAMLRCQREARVTARPLARHWLLAIGAGVGVVSGLVGAGGGFLIVPVLTIFAGLAMHEAIATALFIIGLQSFAGFAGHLGHVALDWRLTSVMASAGVIGVVGGSALSRRVAVRTLKRAFAGLILGSGLFVLGRQLPLAWTALVGVGVLVAAFLLACREAARVRVLNAHRV